MVIKCTSGLFCRTALSIFSNGFILQPSFPHRRDVLQAHDPAIWGRFHQTSATGSRTPARTAETRRPIRAFPAPFFRAGNLAFRREASHDLAIMSMPFTPPYATEKAWALPVRHPCCPYQTIHLGRFTVGNPLHFAETPLPALREDRLFLPLIFRFTKEYFHKPLFLRNRIDTRPMLD